MNVLGMQIGKGWGKRVYKRERRDALLFLKNISKGIDNYCKGIYYKNINIARAIIERSDCY